MFVDVVKVAHVWLQLSVAKCAAFADSLLVVVCHVSPA